LSISFAAFRFDPETSTRRFALMMPDHVVDLVMPRLLGQIGKEAPGVRLTVAPWRGLATMAAELARSVDLIIACTDGEVRGFKRQRLFGDTEAVAVRRGHKLRRRLRTLDGFLKARHVAVVGRGQREDPVDAWLLGHGVERQIALTVPSYLQALHVAARTDLAAFIPKRLIEALAGLLSLAMVRRR